MNTTTATPTVDEVLDLVRELWESLDPEKDERDLRACMMMSFSLVPAVLEKDSVLHERCMAMFERLKFEEARDAEA